MRNGPFRSLLRALLVALLLLISGSVHTAPAPVDSTRAPAVDVRTGTTSLQAPEALPERSGIEAPESADLGGHGPPGDAPRFGQTLPKIPPPPSSHNTYNGGWIRFAYHPSVRARVQPLIEHAEQIRAELTRRLGQPVLSKVTVHVARTPGEMASLAPEGAPFPKYAAGVAYSQIGLVLLTIAPIHPNSQHDLPEIFKHELAHVALYDAVEGRAVPRWFNEGFAVFASDEGALSRWQTLWTATLSDNLLPLEQLERGFPADAVTASVAYAEAVDVVRFLVRRQEEDRFGGLVERIKHGQSFEQALKDAYGTDLANLEFEWREDVARRYTFWPIFFSGSMIWAAAIGLFVWGWRRRRRKSQETLARWAREEAAEDASMRKSELQKPRVHIVIARSSQREAQDLRASMPDVEVPKVEHEGQWHTLH